MHFQRFDHQRHLCLGCYMAADLNLVPAITMEFSPVTKHLISFICFRLFWSAVEFSLERKKVCWPDEFYLGFTIDQITHFHISCIKH